MGERRGLTRELIEDDIGVRGHTLTSGTFGTEPRPAGGVPPFGPGGFGLRAAGRR